MFVILACLASAEAQHDDFWDYDQQVDLESFSAPTVYDILSRQARDVTKDLGKQKEEVIYEPIFT